jgi:hypothetical protein
MARKAKQPSAPPWQPDATNPRNCHRLKGLEPDNLLAFMALIGLLRALETARPIWRPRAFWDVETDPWRPVLTLAEPQTEAAVACAAAEGVRTLARHHAATGDQTNLRLSPGDFDALYQEADALGRGVLDALCCHGATRDNDTLWPTPFAFMFGQGHQHFLTRFRKVPADQSPSDVFAAALFAPWKREDRTEGFRWDPAEDRRYALRAFNPSTDTATAQHGANALAAICLPLLPVTPIRRRGETRVLTPMTRYGTGGQIEFTWPLWTRSASLVAILALLRHPELAKDSPQAANLPQTATLLRARRISVGKYFNVTPAAPP